MLPLEAVPNFSEGRDRATIDAIGDALSEHARLLDVHSDADHNRSVYTLVGSPEELVAALVAGIACARERIDLRGHEGAHPRIGAADVVPLVPIRDRDAHQARAAALELARRVGQEVGLPVFLYADLAPGLGPAFFRRGGPTELQRRIDAGELAPDFGPTQLDERAGGVIVGARPPLIAFNVNLATDRVEVAKQIAAAVRHSSGGFRFVKAMGLLVADRGIVQVSMNLTNHEKTPVFRVFEAVKREAARYGVAVLESEIVGLVPASALLASAKYFLQLDAFDPRQVLETRLAERS